MGNYNRDDNRPDISFGRNSGGGGGGRSFGGPKKFGGSGRPDMHRATCNDCGNSCEVPFRPTGSKPVFCSNCFEKQGGGGNSRPSYGNDRGNDRRDKPGFSDRQMHNASCDKCGDNCEVPFRPTPGKPIFCDNCFEKGAKGSKDGGSSYEDFKTVNAKLDMIMTALGLSPEKEVKAKKVEKTEKKEENKPAKKITKKVPAKKTEKKEVKKEVKKTANPKAKAVKKVAKKAPAKKKAVAKKKK